MRIDTKNIEVVLGETDCARIVFAPMKVNQASKIRAIMVAADGEAARQDALFAYRQAILETCVSVENLFENDCAVDPEKIKSGDVFPATIEQIVSGYVAAINPPAEEAEAKNDSPAQDSSSA